MKISLIILYLIILIFISCKSTSINKSDSIILLKNKILFLDLKFYQNNKSDDTNVKLLNAQLKDGRLKIENYPHDLNEPTFEIQFINRANKIIRTFPINPLNPDVEFINDNLEFSKKSINLGEVELSLRVNIPEDLYYIKIIQFKNNIENHKLTIPIDEIKK